MKMPECIYRSWLVQQHDPDIDVIITEKNLGFGRLMEVMGDEINVRQFFKNTCYFCVVRNTTTDLIPVIGSDPNILSFSCVVDNENEGERLCLNDYAEDNITAGLDEISGRDVLGELLELDQETMDLLYRIIDDPDQFRVEQSNLEMTFKRNLDFEIVIRRSGDVVELMGDGTRVMAFMQKNCSVCVANPFPQQTIPDIALARMDAVGVTCCPILGREDERNCS